jgi:AcrR family transcriptional regulator
MRRPPRQKRSRETLGHLLDATAATVAELGLDGTTTNHIAKKAGVSIGSLYQYFPDKEAMIEAMMERLGQQIAQDFRARASQVDINRLALRDVVNTLIVHGMHKIRTDRLMLELVRNWNRLPVDKVLDPVEQLFHVMAQPYFLKNYRDYPVENLEAKLYVLINSALFARIRYLLQETPTIPESDFVHTLAEMILGLLEGRRA